MAGIGFHFCEETVNIPRNPQLSGPGSAVGNRADLLTRRWTERPALSRWTPHLLQRATSWGADGDDPYEAIPRIPEAVPVRTTKAPAAPLTLRDRSLDTGRPG
ncbi:hypothetical protein GCM10010275_13600 [Streptomyces litmocidini]|nr:hypothetical protein GCM10010275_13600 [Streptomyces litmocidini]